MKDNLKIDVVPEIVFDNVKFSNCKKVISNYLINYFPESLLESISKCSTEDQILDLLPFMGVSPNLVYCDSTPCQVTFFVLSPKREGAFNFFYEMVSRWLVPGKRLDVLFLQSCNFRFNENIGALFTLSEILVQIDEEEDFVQLQNHLPVIETEVLLGMTSGYYARRILEIKGALPEEKTVEIYENCALLIKKKSQYFDYELLSQLQQVLTICSDTFKQLRTARHLTRIICYHFLFRKFINNQVVESPKRRHVFVKAFKRKLFRSNQNVVGIAIGFNFFNEKESFDEKYALTVIEQVVADAVFVKDSFFLNRLGKEELTTVYLEVEKRDGREWPFDEVKRIQKSLSEKLKHCIEPIMYPVFMPCNEEEIMRNMLNLSSQIKYLRDLPQIVISFDRQSEHNIYFTVISVRILRPGGFTIQELFERYETQMEYLHDRVKIVGYLRKKYAKEATVFRVKLSKDQFLRMDYSIDLHKARQKVVEELTHVIGDIRDYNGGMISKQNEVLNGLKKILELCEGVDELLLENFFYSINPVVMRSLLDSATLKTFFLMQQEMISQDCGLVNFRIESSDVFVMIKSEDRCLKEEISQVLSQFSLGSTQLAYSCTNILGVYYLGYLYRCEDPHKQTEFCQTIQMSVGRSKSLSQVECVVQSR